MKTAFTICCTLLVMVAFGQSDAKPELVILSHFNGVNNSLMATGDASFTLVEKMFSEFDKDENEPELKLRRVAIPGIKKRVTLYVQKVNYSISHEELTDSTCGKPFFYRNLKQLQKCEGSDSDLAGNPGFVIYSHYGLRKAIKTEEEYQALKEYILSFDS